MSSLLSVCNWGHKTRKGFDKLNKDYYDQTVFLTRWQVILLHSKHWTIPLTIMKYFFYWLEDAKQLAHPQMTFIWCENMGGGTVLFLESEDRRRLIKSLEEQISCVDKYPTWKNIAFVFTEFTGLLCWDETRRMNVKYKFWKLRMSLRDFN